MVKAINKQPIILLLVKIENNDQNPSKSRFVGCLPMGIEVNEIVDNFAKKACVYGSFLIFFQFNVPASFLNRK